MEPFKRLIAVACLLPVLSLPAQQQAGKFPFYFTSDELHVELLLSPPPRLGSSQDVTEFNEVLRMQRARSADDLIRAKRDDAEEDMFVFSDVMGPGFTASHLPAMAQLSARLKNDSEIVDPPLKRLFGRPRPYVRSAEVRPVCALSKEPSYPSGHAMLGYLFGYVLAEIAPEKHEAILKRADEYAINRLVCGVHYRSDVEASRLASAVLYGAMLSNSAYRHDVEAARREWHMQKSSNLPQ
jgi:acid phosphatase (class A)